MRFLNRTFRRFTFSLSALLLLGIALWFGTAFKQSESTLAIRPASSNVSLPDGFSVWHHLDANGIHFKSITPLNDGLVIKFESSDQSAAATSTRPPAARPRRRASRALPPAARYCSSLLIRNTW